MCRLRSGIKHLPCKMESHGGKNHLSKLVTWVEVDFIRVNLVPQSISSEVKANIPFSHSRCPVHLVNTFQKCPFHVPELDDWNNPFVRGEPGAAC